MTQEQIVEGNRNYEKFFTPQDIADTMAHILDPKPDEVILEPSAGNGALVAAVKRKCDKAHVFAFEINPKYLHELRKLTPIAVTKDFLAQPFSAYYSGCIANPPFGNGVDLQAHFDKIREWVKPGGMVVMIVPATFSPKHKHIRINIDNWSKNSDGTTTKIKLIYFIN